MQSGHLDRRAHGILLGALLPALSLVLVAAAGCGGGNPHPAGTLDRADFFAGKGKQLEAVAAYESFVRHNPTDSLAAEAQFRKAMIYMDLEEYPLAAVEFQILRKDFPTSDRVEESLFQEGLAYRRQVTDIARDTSGAIEARKHFERFRTQYPASPRLPDVTAELAGISDLVVRKRLDQVKVFRQLGRWQAVATVLDRLLAEEPGSSLVPRVLWERAAAAEKLGDREAAAAFHGRLAAEYPGDSRAREAAAAAARLAAGGGS
ncbi:MAG: outer membrane protein assembly factor BamD [bacterium]|nr:outer membrane protein assembly factor BamD [bacterium]